MKIEKIRPEEIEARSFAIIREELEDMGIRLPKENAAVILRCIHTSADFDYARNLVFSPGAVEQGVAALREGCSIVTDTRMGWSGLNKKRLEKLGGKAYCFMADTDVAREAKERGITRAAVSMEKAAALEEDLIFAIGNAPTALIRLYELIREGKVRPRLVIAAPVGFVNVLPAKELIRSLADIPYIVAGGRKGGSNIAACICNALLLGT
ncbi:MAG: precorrin-8X methylmutase [Massilistercora timonensis]|uniref:precorrin-8X methylmutase n=1 Tax=Massilistercora timonensis TaxID=2086584 RepID=UPI002F9F0BDB